METSRVPNKCKNMLSEQRDAKDPLAKCLTCRDLHESISRAPLGLCRFDSQRDLPKKDLLSPKWENSILKRQMFQHILNIKVAQQGNQGLHKNQRLKVKKPRAPRRQLEPGQGSQVSNRSAGNIVAKHFSNQIFSCQTLKGRLKHP